MPIILLLLWFACIVSWAANIIKLAGIINDPVTGLMILRVVGIPFAPLGVVLGLV